MPKKKTPGSSYAPPKPEGFGLASRGADKSPQIRHTRPEVAKHCARMIIAHNMDTQAAVSKMLATQYPDATEAQVVQLARTIQASPHVQREMTKLLEDIGFGDDALKKLIGILWQEVLGGNDKRWAAAARLLAEITGASRAAEKGKKLPTLRLGGMEECLSQMLGDAAPTDDVGPELRRRPAERTADTWPGQCFGSARSKVALRTSSRSPVPKPEGCRGHIKNSRFGSRNGISRSGP